jgi:fluoroquinolone resistance protein
VALETLSTDRFFAILAEQGTIENADLSSVDWNDADCDEARLVKCRLIGCRFAHTKFRAAWFEDCIFTDRAKSTGSVFAFSELSNARFHRCDLSFCAFDRSNLFNIDMEKCTLRGARFVSADFAKSFGRSVVAPKASMRECNFELAALGGVRLPQCNLSGSSFHEADLVRADLSGADLRYADLEGTELSEAKLAKADLRGAKIAGLNLLALATRDGMKIDASQQWLLLTALGIEVDPH